MPGLRHLRLLSPLRGPVGAFSPLNISGLILWLKADSLSLNDGAAIGTWTDSSGSGNDATQSTVDNKPLYKTNIKNGKPIVRFDGVNDSLATASSIAQVGTGDLAIFAVANGGAGNSRDVIGNLQNATPFGGVILKTRGASGFIDGEFRSTVSGSAVIAGSTSNTGWQIMELVRSSGTAQLFKNGSQVGSDTSSSQSVNSAQVMQIGRDRSSGSEFFDSDMAEVLIYAATLSSSDRPAIRNYLNAKYAIY